MRGTPPVRTGGGGERWEASPEAAPRAAGTERPPAPRAHAHSAEARRWDSDPPGLAAFTVGGRQSLRGTSGRPLLARGVDGESFALNSVP